MIPRWVEVLKHDPDALNEFLAELKMHKGVALAEMESAIVAGDMAKAQIALGKRKAMDDLKARLTMHAKEEAQQERLRNG